MRKDCLVLSHTHKDTVIRTKILKYTHTHSQFFTYKEKWGGEEGRQKNTGRQNLRQGRESPGKERLGVLPVS